MGVRASYPISIGVNNQVRLRTRVYKQAHMHYAADIVQNPLESDKMRLPWVMHMKTDLPTA
jgi:hypothetical protein